MAGERVLKLNIIGDTASLEKALSQGQTATAKFEGGLGGLVGKIPPIAAVGAAVVGMAAGAVAWLNKATNSTIDFGKSTIGLQRMTGLSAESASTLSAVFNRLGIDSDSAGKLIKSMTKDMTSQKGTIQALGIQVKDGQGHYRNYADVIGDFSDKFKAMKDPVEKNAAAQAVFGKQWQSMLPMLSLGKQGIADLTAKAKEYGLVLTDQNVNAIKKYVSASKDADMASQGLQVQFGLIALPIKTFIAQAGAEFFHWLVMIKPAVQAVAEVVRNTFGTVIQSVGAVVTPVINNLKNVFAGLFGESTTKANAFKTIFKTVGDIIGQVIKFVTPIIYQFKISIVQNLGVIIGWVKENWPLISATIKQVMAVIKFDIETVLGAIKIVFEAVWPVIQAVVETVWNVIKTVVSTTLKAVLGIIKTVMQLITGDWKGAWESLKGVVVTVFDGIRKLVGNLVDGFINIGVNIVKGLWNGINSMGSWLYERIMTWVNNVIPGPVKKALGIKSPSTLFHGYGTMLAAGLANGIVAGTSLVSGAADSLAQSAIPSFNTPGFSFSSAVGRGYNNSSAHQTIIVELDGRTIAKTVVENMPGVLRLAGVKL